MIRSIWKPIYNDKLLEIKQVRSMTVIKEDVGKIVKINGGRYLIDVHIIPNMVGNKFGKLSLTKKKVIHQRKKKKK